MQKLCPIITCAVLTPANLRARNPAYTERFKLHRTVVEVLFN